MAWAGPSALPGSCTSTTSSARSPATTWPPLSTPSHDELNAGEPRDIPDGRRVPGVLEELLRHVAETVPQLRRVLDLERAERQPPLAAPGVVVAGGDLHAGLLERRRPRDGAGPVTAPPFRGGDHGAPAGTENPADLAQGRAAISRHLQRLDGDNAISGAGRH